MERERITWGLMCWACMPDMTDAEVKYICDVNDDVFELEENEVKFTKTFLDEAKKVGGMS